MDDEQSGFFGRFYTTCAANSSLSKEVSNPCKPGQKSFVAGLFDPPKPKEPPPERTKVSDEEKRAKDEDEPAKAEASIIERAQESEQHRHHSHRDDETDLPPESLCFIKEQNPLEPCCCELKTDDDDGSPCPPAAGYSENPRVPGCGCELCRKSGYHGSCCGGRTYVQGGDKDPPQFQQA